MDGDTVRVLRQGLVSTLRGVYYYDYIPTRVIPRGNLFPIGFFLSERANTGRLMKRRSIIPGSALKTLVL